MSNILIIDDEKAIRKTLSEILSYEGYKIDEAGDGEEGLKKFREKEYDVILCDIKMPKIDGIEFLEKAKELNTDIPIIMISGHGTIETAVAAVKKGAYDYISKPPDLNRLLITIRNAMDKTLESPPSRSKTGIPAVDAAEFGCLTFTGDVMLHRLPAEVFEKLQQTMKRGLPLDPVAGGFVELIIDADHEMRGCNQMREAVADQGRDLAERLAGDQLAAELARHRDGDFDGLGFHSGLDAGEA